MSNKSGYIVFLIISFFLGIILGLSNPINANQETTIVDQPVHHTVYVPQYIQVEHTTIINNTKTQIIEVPIIINQTIPVYTDLVDWKSKTQLMAFIMLDKTDQLIYSTDFDCDDFALRTIDTADWYGYKIVDVARREGYRIYFFYQYIDRDTAHAMCMAYVKKEALYIIWDPQTDEVWAEWSSTRGG